MRFFTDLRGLNAFVTVAREGNVTRAAEILHLSQPAVTQQLKRLAETCGFQLFRRTPQGLELTPNGMMLVPKAVNVLTAMGEFGSCAHNLRGGLQGHIRVGTVIDPEFTRLGDFLAEINRTAPGIEAELFHGVSGDVLSRLLRDEIDVGYFLGELEIDGRGSDEPIAAKVHRQVLTSFSYVVIAPPGWAHKVAGLSWVELAKLPWVGTQPSSVHSRLLRRVFDEYGVTPQTVARVDQELSMMAMVRAGMGLSLCRASQALIEKKKNGIAIADRVEIKTELSFITLEARRADPRIACVFDALSHIWSDSA